MADSKITALASIGTGTDPANDPLVIVDVSDVSPGGMSATGTTKKVTLNNLLACSPTATLASATITGDLTVDTSTLKVDSANDRVGIGTATPGGALEVFKNTNGQNRLFLNNPSTGTGAYDAIDFTAGTANNQILSMGSGYSGSFPYLTGALLLRSAQANGIVLNTAGSAAAIQFGINDTLGMTLNATGLGVGLVPANDKLSVSQTIGLVTSTTADVNFRNIGNTTIQRIRYDDSTGTLTIGSALGTAYPVQIGGNTTTRAVTIDASQNVGIGVTPSGSGGCLQLKSGITFPATQVASSDANTLDDYEEGTWVPTISAASGTPTTTTVNSATYTKIGRQVVCTIDVSIVNKGTASSSLQFSLPFNQTTATRFCGAFREDGSTGNMGMIISSTSVTAACLLYNNDTPWVDGYRVAGTYTYFIA